MPQPDKDWISLGRDAYEAGTTYMDAFLRPEWEKSLKQWQGRHAGDSKYFHEAYKGRSKLFRPKTRGAIRKNEAMAAGAYFSTQDVVSITPTDDSQPLSRLSADLHHGLLNHRLTHTIPWFRILIGAYREAQSWAPSARIKTGSTTLFARRIGLGLSSSRSNTCASTRPRAGSIQSTPAPTSSA